jgi:Helix-turn-helix of DDE superfamily endonuclease
MSYSLVKKLEPTEFKRLCGVTPATFEQMVKVVAAEKVLAKKSGRPSKLSIEDQVLMTLEYWREYRTHFHIGVSWGLDETNVSRNIEKIEKILIKSGLFSLRGKKKVIELDAEEEVLVVDVAEHEIERSKKTEKTLQWQAEMSHTKITDFG